MLITVNFGNTTLSICYALYWASEARPTLGCSVEILRDIYRYVGLSMGNHTKSTYVKKCVGEITWPKHAHAQSLFWEVKTELKANRASEIEEHRKERLENRKPRETVPSHSQKIEAS